MATELKPVVSSPHSIEILATADDQRAREPLSTPVVIPNRKKDLSFRMIFASLGTYNILSALDLVYLSSGEVDTEQWLIQLLVDCCFHSITNNIEAIGLGRLHLDGQRLHTFFDSLPSLVGFSPSPLCPPEELCAVVSEQRSNGQVRWPSTNIWSQGNSSLVHRNFCLGIRSCGRIEKHAHDDRCSARPLALANLGPAEPDYCIFIGPSKV
jgi:hypothetical protein